MSRPIHTLLFSTLYPSGARPLHGVFVETRLRELLNTGQVRTTVVSPVPWFPRIRTGNRRYAAMAATPAREQINGIDVLHPRYLVVPKIGMNLTPFTLAWSARAAVRQLLDEGVQIDVIDAHYYYPDGVAAALLGHWFNKPVVITARGTDVNLIPEYRVPRSLIHWAAGRAQASIGVSAALVERMRSLGMPGDRLHVMRNGVDLQRFKLVDREAARRQLGIAAAPVLLAVGNLYEFKGQRLVVQALAQVRKVHPGAQLMVVGDGQDREMILREVQVCGLADAVRMMGTIPNTELSTWYSAADVMLLASSREGWPNVLLESMACGTPVVACRVGGVPEIVQNQAVGRVVHERTAPALAEAVLDLLANPGSREVIRAYAQEFDWHRTSQDQLNLFTALTGRPQAAPA